MRAAQACFGHYIVSANSWFVRTLYIYKDGSGLLCAYESYIFSTHPFQVLVINALTNFQGEVFYVHKMIVHGVRLFL